MGDYNINDIDKKILENDKKTELEARKSIEELKSNENSRNK